MGYQHVLFDPSDGIATITLNRPAVLNAYIAEMGDDIVAAFRQAESDPQVRVVILTGAGRAFCAGVDLKAMRAQAEATARGGEIQGRRIGDEEFVRTFARDLAYFPKPVIAALNGPAIGVGITMILSCDIRIAAEGAKLGVPFTKLGLTPGFGATQLLSRVVGLGNALELLLTSRIIEAREAAEIGLVNRVVPPERLMDEARAMAALIRECDPGALAATKRMVHFGTAATLEEAMENERGQAEARRRAGEGPVR